MHDAIANASTFSIPFYMSLGRLKCKIPKVIVVLGPLSDFSQYAHDHFESNSAIREILFGAKLVRVPQLCPDMS